MNKIPVGIFILIIILFPIVFSDIYLVHIFTMCCIYAVLVSSWDILSGYGGMFSFGHPIFFGFGGYVSALLALKLGVSPWIGLFIGGGAASLIGFLIGLPVLRLKGSYLAIVTLSFMIIAHSVCTHWTSLTQGPTGLSGIPNLPNIHALGIHINFDGIDRIPHYYAAALILILSVFIQMKFVNSSIGIHLLAIREDEDAAQAVGVNAARCKLIAFLITSFLAGLAGGFYGNFITVLSPGVFGFDIMITIMTMSLLGGAGTTFGPIIGAFVLTFVAEFLREFGDIHLLLYGLFIIFAITFMPQGILRVFWEKVHLGKICIHEVKK
jgi:branched-chain amino acid transport system permease protein